jgi:hypothetical protein
MNGSRGSRYTAELRQLRANQLVLQHNLDEALSEIERHHDLITKLRDECRWLLDSLVAEMANRRVEGPAGIYSHLSDIALFLNREVA